MLNAAGRFSAALGLALLFVTFVGCNENRTPSAANASRTATSNASSAKVEAPHVEASAKAPPGRAPARFGSALLPFVDTSAACASLAASTARQLDLIRDPFLSSSPDDSTARVTAFRELVTTHTACVPAPGGAWATLFEGGADPRAWRWLVGFLPNVGESATHPGNFIDQVDAHAEHATFTGRTDWFDGATYAGPYRLQVVSDYDGDGTPEAVVWTAQIGQEVRTAARGVLWSFSSRTRMVAPFTGAAGLGIAPFEVEAGAAAEPTPLSDLDADGRIDLLGYGPFFGVFKQGCGVVESFDALGPRLALHSLANGTFASSDAMARAHAQRQCPARPGRILVFGERELDRRATLLNLACARLWDVPARIVASETKAACAGDPPPSADCDTPRKCAVEAGAVLAAWSEKKAPFTLK